jgi:zinc transport system permease protein
MRLWPGLLLMTTSEELAHAEGVPVRVYEFLLMLLMGVVVAGAVQLVGALLITSLLIIPASTARLFAKSPEAMGVGGSLIACLSMVIGLPVAEQMAVPIGPAIVSFSVALFLVALSTKLLIDWAKAKRAAA